MTETKSCHESALPAKRKSDLTSQDHDPLPHKSPKLLTQDETIQPSQQDHALHPSGNNDSSVSEPRPENPDPEIDSGEGEEDEDDDYGDDDDEEENGSTPVDRKGKGVLIEEENDSDDEDDDENDDDSSDGGNESEGESDLSDDPLAEVDLDNILPSRTRRRVVRPGLHIAKEVGNKGEAGDSDGSDS
ncbi:hypothetical protein like AT1G12830 [Hibiscus trionum]|uniref:Uncharacterized protein n=1 Tax=Hibiscus trionum TaxID=183268 RepID=A0A9W7GZE8_HIBTR|nr:hypothetical protein like AT1G12830 [Hibiscus trionum]